jgi:hypothetical protein
MARTSLVVVLALTAASWTPALAAPSMDDVLAANKKATGAAEGKAALKIEGDYAGQGLAGKVSSLTDVRDGRFVDSADLKVVTQAQGFDGAHAWTKDPSGSVTQQDGGEVRQLAVNEAYRRANLWWRPDHGGATVVLAGQKTEGGAAYDVVTVAPKDGKSFDAWFNSKTHLLSRTAEIQDTQTVTTTLTDYRAVDGVEIPWKQHVSNGDAKYDQDVTVTSAAFLPSQEDAAYAAPKVVLSDASIAGGKTETTFPFKLINNHIYANVKVNGKGPYQFIFDTGGVNLVTPPLAADLGLKSEGALQGNGAGAGHMDVSLTRVSSLALGDAVVKDQAFMELPLNTMEGSEGVEMPGMVGFETFRRFVTRVDYGAKTITLIKPDAFDPKDAGTAVPITFAGNTIEAAGAYDGVPGTFTIDTGARSSLTLNTPFVAAHVQFAKYNTAPEAVTGWGIGGPTKSHTIRGKALVLGGYTIAAPVVELSTDTQGAMANSAQSGNIGGGVLKRFVVTLDYERSTMYLKPVSGPVDDLDTYDRSGLWINADVAGYKVVDVTKGGPADQGGLRADDVIIAVDGKPATGVTLYAMRARLRDDPPGNKVTFTVVRGGANKDVVVTLRDLI